MHIFLLQMILKHKLRGQGMVFLVGGGAGTSYFTLTIRVLIVDVDVSI
jgi:hypothetical protein